MRKEGFGKGIVRGVGYERERQRGEVGEQCGNSEGKEKVNTHIQEEE